MTASHRALPLRAVDQVTAERGEPEWRIQARKVIDVSDPYMEGHFPAATIYPGVFVIESLRQAVSAGLQVDCDVETVRNARFLLPLVSGDTLTIDAVVLPTADGSNSVTATAFYEGVGIAAKLELVMRRCEVADAA